MFSTVSANSTDAQVVDAARRLTPAAHYAARFRDKAVRLRTRCLSNPHHFAARPTARIVALQIGDYQLQLPSAPNRLQPALGIDRRLGERVWRRAYRSEALGSPLPALFCPARRRVPAGHV